MKNYWIIPTTAACVILSIMAFSLTSIEKPMHTKGSADFANGASITDARFEPTDAQDGHRLMVFKLKQDPNSNVILAIHLNKISPNQDKNEILQVVGDFPVSTYCTGSPMECRIPMAKDTLEHSGSVGVAMYVTAGQLIPVLKGWADWDDHRALFLTNPYHD
ncbi:hypothetical protein [Pseudomonas mosselii]|uniref:hypothetical protein n=1 Tax=Pseudomonas mosselii TaxID=78327 RepID=UPI00300D8D93